MSISREYFEPQIKTLDTMLSQLQKLKNVSHVTYLKHILEAELALLYAKGQLDTDSIVFP